MHELLEQNAVNGIVVCLLSFVLKNDVKIGDIDEPSIYTGEEDGDVDNRCLLNNVFCG